MPRLCSPAMASGRSPVLSYYMLSWSYASPHLCGFCNQACCSRYSVVCTAYCVCYVRYSVLCMLCHVQCIVYSVLCMLCRVQCIMYSVLCISCRVKCIVHSVLCTLCHVQCVMYSLLCTVHYVQSIMHFWTDQELYQQLTQKMCNHFPEMLRRVTKVVKQD